MTITSISRVFFRWYEYEAMVKFVAENPMYKLVAEDTTGTTYECSTTYMVDTERNEDE